MKHLKDLPKIFNRCVEHVFHAQKFLSVFLILLFSGLIFLFFQGLAFYAPEWLKFPLFAFPFFIMCFLLMLSGVELCLGYATEREGGFVQKPFFFSTTVGLKAFYFYAPLIVIMVALIVLLALLMLVKSIPGIGAFFGVILAFIPFLINLSILLLFLAALALLFFFTPLLGLKAKTDRKTLMSRFHGDLFTHLVSFCFAILPLGVVWWFASKAMSLTMTGYSAGDGSFMIVLQGLFILIPLSAIMTLPLIFFFNYSLEAYLTTLSQSRPSQENASDL